VISWETDAEALDTVLLMVATLDVQVHLTAALPKTSLYKE